MFFGDDEEFHSDLADEPQLIEAFARRNLELSRWPDGAVCPYCGKKTNVKPLGGKSMGDGWYHCGLCRRKFTVRTGTILERSHIPLYKWFLYWTELSPDISASELHKELEITYRSAQLMIERVKRHLIHGPAEPWWVNKQ
jgi:transposase-like protein